MLLVVCVDAATAGWCTAPIDLGHPGWVLTPLVLGPQQVPVVTDVDQACREPELAVLSAMAHPDRPDRDKIFHALLSCLGAIDSERATRYSDIVFAALPAAARRSLEALVATGTYEYQSDFVGRYVMQGRAEGRTEGKATALLAILDARGIDVSDETRARITGCSDIEQLDAWIRRAATADSIDALFS